MRVLILLIVTLSSLNAQLIRSGLADGGYRGFSKVDHITALRFSDPDYVELFSNSEIQELTYEIAGTILPKRITLGENRHIPDIDEILQIAKGQLEAPVELLLIVSIMAKEMKPDQYYGYLELSLTEQTLSSFIEHDLSRGKSLLWDSASIHAPLVQRQKTFIDAEKKDIRNILHETTHEVFSRLLNLMLEEP